jgi:lysophospholipase L1-like esterase
MTRTQIVVRGALALVILGAVVSCDNNTNGDLVGPNPVNPMFKSYVALGNSLTAGFQSDGINDSTQKQSYALLLARSMGTRYAYPSLAMPGCRPPLNNFLTQTRVTLAGQPPSTAATCNLRSTSSITAALNNVAVPGIASIDPTSAAPPAQKANPLEQFILGGESMVQRALDVSPTFATVWVGNNDVLSAAIQGVYTGGPQPTPVATFITNYSKMINQLTTGAQGIKGVLIGVVQVAGAPIMVAAAAFASPVFQAGINQATGRTVTYDPGCATSTSLIGFPIVAAIKAQQLPAVIACSKGVFPPPVGDIFVLDAAEQAQVGGIINGYNAYIKAKADSIGFAYYDPNTTLARLATQDPILGTHVPNIGSATAPFGQFVTLDGIHPSAAAHIQIANDIIAVINAKYGTSLAPAG